MYGIAFLNTVVVQIDTLLPHSPDSVPGEGLVVEVSGRMGGQEVGQQGRTGFPGRQDQDL